MSKISRPYHLEIQTRGKNVYGVVRTSYREDGKVMHDNICRFKGLSIQQLKNIQAAFQNKVVSKSEFKILESREYGASFALLSLLKDLGLHTAIHSRPSLSWVKSALAMIIGRLVYAGSKLSLSACGAFSALWEICGITTDVDVNKHCYDAMDKLLERQDAVQKSLAEKHLQGGSVVLYDITSCYLEGEYKNSELVEFGYNRDKKRGTEQIVISLLCNKDGCPVAVDVLAGNTKDETTVLDKLTEIKQKYSLEKIIFVGDRGMITQARYDEIDHETVKVVSALSHGKIKELCNKGTIQMSLFDRHEIVEVIDGNMRYMLCLNPVMAEKERKTRNILLEKTIAELDKIISSTRKSKNSKAIRAGKIVNKYKMAKFIDFKGSDNDLTYALNTEKIEQESALDGCYVVFTDASQEDLTTAEAVTTYKNLMFVEQAFRNLKTAALEIRPIFHKTDERIKSHVFICMLAYYLMWHMQQRLKPLYESDKKGKNRLFSFETVIEILKSIRYETVDFLDARTQIISSPNETQEHILKLLRIKL